MFEALTCDYGDYYDFEFPGDGTHHKTIYVPRCTNIGVRYFTFAECAPVLRCEEHLVLVRIVGN